MAEGHGGGAAVEDEADDAAEAEIGSAAVDFENAIDYMELAAGNVGDDGEKEAPDGGWEDPEINDPAGESHKRLCLTFSSADEFSPGGADNRWKS